MKESGLIGSPSRYKSNWSRFDCFTNLTSQTAASLFESSNGTKEKTAKDKNKRKVFIPRDSMLTVMLDEDENLFAVVLFFWALSLGYNDVLKNGKLNLDLLFGD